MKTFQKINKWFNGKKTVIGLLGTTFLQMDLIFLQTMNPDLKTILLWIFGLLAAGGILHKSVKNNTKAVG